MGRLAIRPPALPRIGIGGLIAFLMLVLGVGGLIGLGVTGLVEGLK